MERAILWWPGLTRNFSANAKRTECLIIPNINQPYPFPFSHDMAPKDTLKWNTDVSRMSKLLTAFFCEFHRQTLDYGTGNLYNKVLRNLDQRHIKEINLILHHDIAIHFTHYILLYCAIRTIFTTKKSKKRENKNNIPILSSLQSLIA